MKIKRRVYGATLYLALGALAVVVVFPIFYVVLPSFKSVGAILTSSSFFPEKISFHNYARAWRGSNFRKYIWNSVLICTAIVIRAIVTSITSGYAFSRENFPGEKSLLGLIILSMFISTGGLYLFPQLQIAKSMYLNNSLWGIIITYIFRINVAQLCLSKGFTDEIPRRIDEAAQTDGCSFLKTFLYVILPLTGPFITTVGLLSFTNSQNDCLLSLVFTLGNLDKQPPVVGIMSMKNAGGAISSWDLIMAGMVMAVVSMLIVFVTLNKYFVAGLTSGAVKG